MTATRHRGRRRWHANDEAIAGQRDRGFEREELRPAALSRPQLVGVQQAHFHRDLGGLVVHQQLGAMAQRLGGPGENLEMRVEAAAGAHRPRHREHIAAAHLMTIDAGKVDRGAAPRPGLEHGAIVLLEAANPDPPVRGQDDDLITLAETPTDQRPGDHRPEAGHAKGAVDGQARTPEVRTDPGLFQLRVEGQTQTVEAETGRARDRNDWSALE